MTVTAISSTSGVNLKIGHVANIISANQITVTEDPIAGSSINNLVSGGRSSYYESDTNQHIYDFDFESITSAAIDFVYLANFKSCLDRWDVASADLRVRADNSTAYSNTLLFQTKAYSDLIGSREEDLILSVPGTTAYTHWRVRMQVAAVDAEKIRISKIIPCVLFDFGKDPQYSLFMKQGRGSDFQRHTKKRYEFTWRGVSNDKVDTFNALILPWISQTGLVFHDPGDLVFAGDKVLFANVVNYSHSAISGNSNLVRMEVEEIV